eukprot:Hpha_TRINITY_DN7706_c0_g2::TRINITY_DN7706_c0_g2_i1::g.85451::m.85451
MFRRSLFCRSDPWKTLGVPRSASASEIKAAYYKLAQEHHPDKSVSRDAEAFKKVSAAFTEAMGRLKGTIPTPPEEAADFKAGDPASERRARSYADFHESGSSDEGFGEAERRTREEYRRWREEETVRQGNADWWNSLARYAAVAGVCFMLFSWAKQTEHQSKGEHWLTRPHPALVAAKPQFMTEDKVKNMTWPEREALIRQVKDSFDQADAATRHKWVEEKTVIPVRGVGEFHAAAAGGRGAFVLSVESEAQLRAFSQPRPRLKWKLQTHVQTFGAPLIESGVHGNPKEVDALHQEIANLRKALADAKGQVQAEA